MNEVIQLNQEQRLTLGAKSIPTFGQIYFPRTFRQKSPHFHYEMSEVLEDPASRLVAFELFRDSAKTSIARTYTAKRISYCISRTILLVNISATKAEHSLRWLKRQVEHNTIWREDFKLRKGDKWKDDWIQIINSLGEPVNIVAAGITSGLRGLNIDDFRPDFIFCDDISDRENTATEEQRAKANEAMFGQLVRSLAPKSESPLAQLVLAQTPINTFDIVSQTEKDPQFRVVKYSCFGPDGQSAWPERRTTQELLDEKAGYIKRNQLSTWLAEMECTIVSGETQAFRREWLRFWNVYPDGGRVAICIDPASSEEKTADFFAIAVLLFHSHKVYLLEYELHRGLMPDAAMARIMELAMRYNARDLVVETVAYQKILAWYLREKIKQTRMWLNVHEINDKRRKDDRIVQAITLVAPYGNLLIREGMSEFEELFELYGPGYGGKVDLIDAVAMGIIWNMGHASYQPADIEGEFQKLREIEDSLEDINAGFQGAP